jgi:sigma-B regulation protein RsbU (phosphoserine phosphatase)
MNRRDISASLERLLRLQALCLGIVVASWLIFWAVNQPITNVRDLFIYVLIQVNLSALMLWPLKFLYQHKRLPYYWPVHVISIFAATTVVVVTSALAIYRVNSLQTPFLELLHHSWKFPFVANLVFAFAYETYNVATCRLKRHNRELQQSIDSGAAERELDAAELQQAREIQQGLLPKEIPQVTDFEITGAWEPAKLVGGDYYDVISLGKDKLAICIADVVGKGVSAALLMANVQASVRAFAAETASPAYVCSRINSVLCANIASGKFVTLFYGVLDASSRILQYTNAGHLRPILMGSDGKVKHLENGGALLGVFPDWKYENSTVELGPGDILLLFTDGITEAMDSDGEEFGEERLIQAARNPVEQSIEDLQAHLLNGVKEFCNFRMRDDATLILLAACRVGPEQRKPALINFQNQATNLVGVTP